MVPPTRVPVFGSMPTIPETMTCGPALTPWLYNDELGAFGVLMISLDMTDLPLSPLMGAQDKGSQVGCSTSCTHSC